MTVNLMVHLALVVAKVKEVEIGAEVDLLMIPGGGEVHGEEGKSVAGLVGMHKFYLSDLYLGNVFPLLYHELWDV